jgi:hypothetical protein
MAGAGYRLFNTGDVLTAAQVNTNLQQQVIMVFASSAARSSALTGVLAEGMFTYLLDTNAFQYYDGAAFVDVSNPGDITGVTAGTGLSGGGSSGAVTLSIDTATTVDKTTAQTLTNKTLTAPIISSISNTGTLTLPTSTDTLVGKATTDTLTNKTLTAPIISSISNTGTLTLPTSTDTLVGKATTDTLTNKTLTSPVITTPKIAIGYTAKTAAYTVASGDEGYLFSMNNAATAQFNIPTDATFNFAIGTEISFVWITGAGQPTIGAVTPGTTTILSNAATSVTPKLRVVNSAATAIKLAANNWLVIGDIA